MVYGSVSLFGFTPASISGKISHSCTIPGIRLGGQVGISRLKEGLYITGLSKDLLQVHYSQLVSAHFVEAVKVKQQGKSVIGRAAVGAVLLGPFGAIIGGMSGMGKNEKVVDGISLTYWHVGAKRYDTLLVESGTNSLSGFCTLLAKECAPFEAIHLEARL